VVFPGINDGVYRCWFGGPEAHAAAFQEVQAALAYVDNLLLEHPFLCGSTVTLADVRAFPHLFRFDGIYHRLMLREEGPLLQTAFPRIGEWMQRMFADPRTAATCDLQVATRFYLGSAEAKDDDAHYAKMRHDWMPTIPQLEDKRAQEGLPAAAAAKP
jgi:putative glutathione S-transferase